MKAMIATKAMEVTKATKQKAAKAMKQKAMKAMRAMKQKAVSKIARGREAKSLVLKGNRVTTKGGLTAADLCRNQYGKTVNKKRRAFGQKNSWMAAVCGARQALGLKGWVAVKKGSELYQKAKELYAPMEAFCLPRVADETAPPAATGEPAAGTTGEQAQQAEAADQNKALLLLRNQMEATRAVPKIPKDRAVLNFQTKKKPPAMGELKALQGKIESLGDDQFTQVLGFLKDRFHMSDHGSEIEVRIRDYTTAQQREFADFVEQCSTCR